MSVIYAGRGFGRTDAGWYLVGTPMRPAFLRTLSARILAGFALLIVVFGATMIWIVTYMNDLRSEIEVIRTRYLKLTIASKDLAGQQQMLFAYLRDEMAGEGTPTMVSRRLHRLRTARGDLLDRLTTTLEGMHDLPRGHGAVVSRYLDRATGMKRSVEQLADTYVALLAAPPIERSLGAEPPTTDPARLQAGVAAQERLLDAEHRLFQSMGELADQLRVRTERIAGNLEYNASRLRLYTGMMGLVAVLAGLLVTAWVTVSLRPLGRLRSAARRIAAGDYGSRIEEQGPAEVADLAREFNAMGRAVEERERELVRSERLAAVGKMAAMITHEVRNPLSSIALNTELLEEELASSPGEAREICRAITREVDRLTAITEEYLSFARLPKPRLTSSSLPALVDDLARFVREDLASRQVELVVEHGDDLPAVMCDEGQIRQALLNLVRNAAEAMSGRGGGHVWVRTQATDTVVTVAVADDGPGIAPELRDRLFDPFVSTKDGGTGLGLALSHQIIKDHGGTILVTSTPGEGATFTLELPRA